MSFQSPSIPDDRIIEGFHAMQKILDLTPHVVQSILGGEVRIPLNQEIRQRIYTLLRIIALQDRGWNYASYPHVRPTFEVGCKVWFHTPQSDLDNTSPIDYMRKNPKAGIDYVLKILESRFQSDHVQDFSGMYTSLSSGHKIEYP